jgi:aryl-alcohol dehydrogenase-like predicted oxidoreductase
VPVERFVPREKWGPDHQRAEAMRQWCEARGVPLLRLALHFCLGEGRIHGNPLGSLNIEQLEKNVAAVLEPLPPEVLAEFEQAGL